MAEPLADLSPEHSAPGNQNAETANAAAALERSADLPFFDLDIALIRRGQQKLQPMPVPMVATPGLSARTELPAQPPSASPSVISKPATVAPQPAHAPAALPSREQQALAALEALLQSHGVVTSAPVTHLPRPMPAVTPTPAPVVDHAPAAKYVMPTIMPMAASTSTGPVNFVQPGFERVVSSMVQPVAHPIETAEPQAKITEALLQVAGDVTTQAANLLPSLQADLKFRTTMAAIARREAMLAQAARSTQAQPVQAAAVQLLPIPAAASEAEPAADDLPWGHVTYRLMVM